MENRILLNEDRNMLGRFLSDLGEYRTELDAVKATFEQLELGPFNDEDFKLIKSNIKELENRFRSEIEKEIERLGIKRSSSQAAFREQSEPLWTDFIQAVNKLKAKNIPLYIVGNRTGPLTLEYIDYDDKKGFWVSPISQERILEQYCRQYVDSANELAVYNALTKLGKAAEKFDKLLIDLGLINDYKMQISYSSDLLFTQTDEGYRPKVSAVKLVSFIERRRKKEQLETERLRKINEEKRKAHEELMAKFDSGEIVNIADPHGQHKWMQEHQ